MKIAIPTENDCLHGHFGGCRHFSLVEVDLVEKTVIKSETVPAPEHQPGAFPRWLREQGVEVVIAGGIGHRALANFAHHGITVRAGLPKATVEELVHAYLAGKLVNSPEGCEHHGDGHGGGHGHHHHHHHDHHHGHTP